MGKIVFDSEITLGSLDKKNGNPDLVCEKTIILPENYSLDGNINTVHQCSAYKQHRKNIVGLITAIVTGSGSNCSHVV